MCRNSKVDIPGGSFKFCPVQIFLPDTTDTQYEIRQKPYINILENTGFLIGGEFKIINHNISLTINPEFRYYGWMYNYNHRNDSVSYRAKSKDQNNLYNNTVGDYLYPIRNYYYQFSQWAVYTDYQLQNIAGAEFRLNFNWQLSPKFEISIETESCTLIKEYKRNNSKMFNYFFYTSQICYNVGEAVKIGLGINNKSMNLDKHYHSFYMKKEPNIHYFIRKAFNKN